MNAKIEKTGEECLKVAICDDDWLIGNSINSHQHF